MKPRYISALVAILLGLGLALAALLYKAPQTITHSGLQTGVAGAQIGGSLSGLTDQTGKTVTDADFAGKAQLVFFGFTHCPSICPTELQKMTLVLEALSESDREKVAAIFVTLDPARDTAENLAEYLSMFHPQITGLTGSPEQIEQIKSEWKVYSARVQTPRMTEYTIDHSAFTYLRDPDGNLLALFAMTDAPGAMANQVKAYLKRFKL